MDRRVFMSILAGVLLAAPLCAHAQRPEKVPRVGYLSPGSSSDPLRQHRLEAFRQGLRELGYVEGQNIAIECRWTEDKVERYPALTADLVRLKVDVIVAVTGAATRAAQQATRTIPIVMSIANDPVGSGLVASLSHPGGNVTEARNPKEIDSAFAAMSRERAGALLILGDSLFGSQRRQISEFTMKRQLPSLFAQGSREYVEAGGLMIYSPNLVDLERRAAIYVDKILKGAKPADLPVEQPTKFELVINLKTAKALGLTIPQSVLGRADEVIQ
jgi:putative ABC transport system substrate-binding protein